MSQDPNFKASKGWLRRFTIRHNFHFTPMKTFRNKSKKTAKSLSIKTEQNEPFIVQEQASGIEANHSESELEDDEESSKLFEVEDSNKEIPLEPQWQVAPKEEQESFTLYSFLNFSYVEKPDETANNMKSHLLL